MEDIVEHIKHLSYEDLLSGYCVRFGSTHLSIYREDYSGKHRVPSIRITINVSGKEKYEIVFPLEADEESTEV